MLRWDTMGSGLREHIPRGGICEVRSLSHAGRRPGATHAPGPPCGEEAPPENRKTARMTFVIFYRRRIFITGRARVGQEPDKFRFMSATKTLPQEQKAPYHSYKNHSHNKKQAHCANKARQEYCYKTAYFMGLRCHFVYLASCPTRQ